MSLEAVYKALAWYSDFLDICFPVSWKGVMIRKWLRVKNWCCWRSTEKFPVKRSEHALNNQDLLGRWQVVRGLGRETKNSTSSPPPLLTSPSSIHPDRLPLPPKRQNVTADWELNLGAYIEDISNPIIIQAQQMGSAFCAPWPTPYLPVRPPSPAAEHAQTADMVSFPSLLWTLFMCHPFPSPCRIPPTFPCFPGPIYYNYWMEANWGKCRKLPGCLGSEITGTTLLLPQRKSVTTHAAQGCNPFHLLLRWKVSIKHGSTVTIHSVWFCRKPFSPSPKRITILLEEILIFESHYILPLHNWKVKVRNSNSYNILAIYSKPETDRNLMCPV